MEELLDSLLAECRPYTRQGKVATYIPELAKGDPSNLGIYVLNSDGRHYQAGDWQKHFTIQSVVKPILLLLALLDNGEEVVRSKVGVEATGKPFDAINVTDSPLLSEHLNPMVNMGAIAICTLLKGKDYTERFQRLLEFTRLLAGNPEIEMDEAVYRSEKRTGSKNRALAFLLKSYGMLDDGVEEVLDCYFRACSIRVNSRDLAHISFALANHGKALQSDEPLFPRPVRPLCERHHAHLRHVRWVGGLRHPGGPARQERGWRRYYGRGAHPYGHWDLLTRLGRKREQPGRHSDAGAPVPADVSEYFLTAECIEVRLKGGNVRSEDGACPASDSISARESGNAMGVPA